MSENGEKTFIGKVQKGYRIQIPEAIRELLNIHEGDIIEVKIKKETQHKREQNNEKENP